MIEGIRWKFVAAIGVLAMAVSLLSGGLSGIRFGMLLVRAFVGGALFTVLAAGLNILMIRFFPEIFESGTAFAAESDDEGTGRHVDIVMPAENPGYPAAETENIDSQTSDTDGAESGIPEQEEKNDTASDVEPESSEEDNVGDVGDLDRFSADFSDVEDDSIPSTRSVSEVLGMETDPQEIAQAIQTVIKREKKG